MTTAAEDNKLRKQQIPLLHVRGTHYEIGWSIGRTFKGLIEDFFESYSSFKEETIPHYETKEGRQVFNSSLDLCRKRFPQYVREVEGMADGAKIPFNHLFLLNIEGLLQPFDPDDDLTSKELEVMLRAADLGSKGCTSVISNHKDVVLGHTEDALKQMMNNFYIISAEVLDEDDEGVVQEKFTTLTYPGQLPGGTMGFNTHGLVHTINTIFPKQVFPERTPTAFLTRSMLGAKSLNEVIEILKDEGSGAADGFGVNLICVSDEQNMDGSLPRVLNIEVSPSQKQGKDESELFVEEISRGDCYSHCNQFLRCTHPEKQWFVSSSLVRHEIIKKYPVPFDLQLIQQILSDEVGDEHDKVKYSIFKRALRPDDHYATIAVGIFDITGRKWNLYTRPPTTSPPVAVIPLHFQSLNP